ncbi:MAG TPA: ATP-dependent zinc metalloprotease FtsH [Gemmatimonadales bacterium]|nr:ATP-dependent zinc metalloprotease FtsH [Gemmatimonadales bacterium]
MTERTPQRPQGPNWAGLSRSAALWVMVILVSVVLFQQMSKRAGGVQEFAFSAFQAQLDAGNVQNVTFIDGSRIEGDFRAPVRQDDGRTAHGFTVLLPIRDSEQFLARIEAAHVPIKAKEDTGGIGLFLLQALPWLLMFGVMFFLIRQMQAGGNRAFSFGKSRAKLLTGDTPKVTFADVAGADEAKQELQEIIEFLKDPHKFTRLGGRLPKGALLVGPPGTGKTLLARAVAGEAGRPFFSMSGSDFVEMFVGVGASRVRDLFEQGKAHAPCIMFIDEIDAVGRHRGAGLGGGHDEREQTLNQLLVEMDGFESNDGVILIAATNRPDVLDPALLRPGRFDRQIVVDAPDAKGREQILKVHTRKIPLGADVKLDVVAKGTPGMVGADLANLVNEAAVLAARGNKSLVEMRDFEEAKDKLMLGLERRSLVLSEEDRKLTAFHEAGHTVVSLFTPGSDPVHKVTIVPRGRALGLMSSLPEKDRLNATRQWLVGRLAIAFGGRVAEELIFGMEKVTTGAGSDIQQATDIARQMVTKYGMSDKVGMMAVEARSTEVFLGRDFGTRHEVSEHTAKMVDEEVKRLLDEAYARAKALLTDHRDVLDRLALALLERETLNTEEVNLLFQGKPLPPPAEPPTPRPAAPVARLDARPATPPILGGPAPEPSGA